MCSVRCSYLCITNNPELEKCVSSVEYIDGSIVDVLKKGRDLIHLGWTLLSNPMYGNLKPNQQPFRTLVLQVPSENSAVDMESLSFIEEGLRVFGNASVLVKRGELVPVSEADFAYLDFNLMRDTLDRCSILSGVMHRMTDGRTLIKSN